jgi:hypothetical protein
MNIWNYIKELFVPYQYSEARRRLDSAEKCSAFLRLELDCAAREQTSLREIANDYNRRYAELRAQVMQIRVSQSTVKRAGWEVMCFIPEECLDPKRMQYDTTKLVQKVAAELVLLALGGVNRVRSNGSCCALVFEPLNINGPARAPRFVQALWDKGGEFKLSEKCWDQRSEEQRVRSMV